MSQPSPATIAARVVPKRSAASFGRVETDGTVFVRLPDGGELAVGQCAPDATAAGLDLFARRYDELHAEVELTMRRVADGKSAPDAGAALVAKAREAIAKPTMVGDFLALETAVTGLETAVAGAREQRRAARNEARATALAARTEIVFEAERLADSTRWKVAGDRLKELLESWKAAPHADRTTEAALWARLRAARNQFDRRRREHFATLEVTRAEAGHLKVKLVKEAQGLATSRDWKGTTSAYRDLMAKWKAAGLGPRGEDEALWEQFRAAQEEFFAARNAVNAEQRDTETANLRAKEELAKSAEAIDIDADVAAAKAALRSIQDRWEKVGHVPRGDRDAVEGRLRAVEERIRKVDQDRWNRVNPQVQARAEATVRQFQAAIDDLSAQRDKAGADTADIDLRIESLTGLRDAAQSHLGSN